MAKEKVYVGVVRSRNRLTIPFDAWMDAAMNRGVKLIVRGRIAVHKDDPSEGITPDLSYRVAVPFKQGDNIRMYCSRKDHAIILK